MFLIGLTGGISTGKSLVLNLLRSMGVQVIDADIVAREVVQPGKRAWHGIRKEFGASVFNRDGTVNRSALGKIIFSEGEKRKKLNSITHPEIYKSILLKCLRLFVSGHQFAVVDLPLLYESGKMVRFMHKIVVVKCDKHQQVARLMKRDSLTESDALLRINAQMSLEEKCKLADFVIDNSRDKAHTAAQVEEIVRTFRKSKIQWFYRVAFVICTLVLINVFGAFLFAISDIFRILL